MLLLLQDKYFSDLGVAVDQQGLQQQHKDSSVQLLSDLPTVSVLRHIIDVSATPLDLAATTAATYSQKLLN
jgi:hypothetical protein